MALQGNKKIQSSQNRHFADRAAVMTRGRERGDAPSKLRSGKTLDAAKALASGTGSRFFASAKLIVREIREMTKNDIAYKRTGFFVILRALVTKHLKNG